jgi:hypothetical protein
MRFSVDRICELAGLGPESGGLLSEAAAPPATKPVVVPGAPPATPAKPAALTPAKPVAAGSPAAKLMPKPAAAAPPKPMPAATKPAALESEQFEDDVMYEIDETELMEALVGMRQQRLEEATVRDAVRDEIKRALSDKSSSWIYGRNKPSASQVGQVSRGGFGVGFGFSR